MVEDDGGQTLEELNTLQAKRQLDRLYNNTSNASLDVEGDSNGSEEYLEGGEEVALDTSIDKSEMLRGDGNGSEDEAEHMFDDKDNDISAAWEEQNGTDQMSDNEDDDISVAWEKQNKEGLDGQDVGQDRFGHLPTIRGGGKQHLRFQKFKHIWFVSRVSPTADSDDLLLQAINSTQHLRVARNELFPPGPRAKIVQIKLFGPSRQVVQLIDKDFSFSSLIDLALSLG